MPLVPQASGPRKDRDGARPTKKGGSRWPPPFKIYSAVIPGQPAGLNYDVQLHIGESISRQRTRPDRFSDVQLHIGARAMRTPG